MTEQPSDAPVAVGFNLGAIQPKNSGFSRWILAKGQRLITHAMVIPQGGELDFHAHLNEEHIFIVINGEAQFEFANAQVSMRLGQLQSVLIPPGCYYRFCSVGKEKLVLTRVATIRGLDAKRVGLDGKSLDFEAGYQEPPQQPADGRASP
jgi:mannose-6-phosphate isomerase-like protein (cupin superfamily)